MLASSVCCAEGSAAVQVAAPALSALPAREQTLANVLQLEFPVEPRWAVAAVRCDLHADAALFGGLPSLASAVLRLAKSFIPDKTPAAADQWASLLLLLDAVLADVRGAKLAIADDQREIFRVRLEEAGDLVRAARVFSRHGLHLMACVLTASDRSSVSGLLRGLLMNATAAASAADDPGLAFSRLWNDLRDLHMYVFEGQGLSLAYLLREFLRASLLAQQWEVAERCAPQPTVPDHLLVACAPFVTRVRASVGRATGLSVHRHALPVFHDRLLRCVT